VIDEMERQLRQLEAIDSQIYYIERFNGLMYYLCGI